MVSTILIVILIVALMGGLSGRFGLLPAGNCRSYPEAAPGASGKPFKGTNPDGTVRGFADLHLRIRKDGGVATIEPLDEGERVEELSRMLAGLTGSPTARSHAQELLDEAAALRRGRGSARGASVAAVTSHPSRRGRRLVP